MVRMGLAGMGFMGQQHFAIHQGLENVELVLAEHQSAQSGQVVLLG